VYTPPDQADGRPPLKRSTLRKILSILRDEAQLDPETALMIVRMMKGIEIFLDIPTLYRRGKGDCNELVPVRIAELWRAGIMASPYLTFQEKPDGGYAYHATVLWPDQSVEDVSLITGMGGPSRAAERREEIRKNAERLSNYIEEAKRLIRAGEASPEEIERKIDLMGLAPRDGVFKSPYDRVSSNYTDA
jgi:hypothetical protein